MARPKGSKNSYQWWEGDHPSKGKPKPEREVRCLRCREVFISRAAVAYCSKRCLFLANVEQGEGCWIWKGYKRPGGYGEAYIGTKPNRIRLLAHRLAWMVEHGDPGELVVCHKCDNPSCVNPRHLFLGTRADNNADRNAKGRQARGERNGPAKLTEAAVLHIRSDSSPSPVLAKLYGVDKGTIMSIRRRKTWRHLK